MKCLLNSGGLPIQLFLAVCGFAGLRHSEAMRLEISDVCLKEDVIKVRASRTKKKVRRVVPVNKVLKSWLKRLLPQRSGVAHRQGYLVPVNGVSKNMARLTAKTGVEWKHNGLRNTYLSSRAVLEKNLAAIAFDAGTSPSTIRSNYTTRGKGLVKEGGKDHSLNEIARICWRWPWDSGWLWHVIMPIGSGHGRIAGRGSSARRGGGAAH